MTTDILRRTVISPRLSMAGILQRLVALDAAYRQRAHLAALDDLRLRDVGLSRGDIEIELRKPLRPAPRHRFR